MTDKAKLRAYMAGNGNTQSGLARAIGISVSRLNAKINETGSAEFRQSEILAIAKRYAMGPEEIGRVFFCGGRAASIDG